MDRTRIAVWISIAALAVATLSFRAANRSTNETESGRVLFITGGDGPFWQLSAAGAIAAAEQYNVDLTVELPTGGDEEQSNVLKAATPAKYDGVAISPLSPEAQNKVLRSVASDIPLLTFDSDAPKSNRLCYVGTNNYAAGQLAASLVRQAAPDGGKIAVLVATFDKDNAVLRFQGFQDEVEKWASTQTGDSEPSFTVLEAMEDDIDGDRCRENLDKVLNEHPDVVAIVGMFSYHGAILLDALNEMPSAQRPVLIAFDEEKAVLQGIEEGRMYATVVQDPFKYGYESVRMLSAINDGRTFELPIAGTSTLNLPCEAVTASNLDDYRARLNKRLASAGK